MTSQNQTLEPQLVSNSYFVCIEPLCSYKGYQDDNICPNCYSFGIVIDLDELATAPDGADVLEYIDEQMGFS